jgi:glycosyltransferase involved in cell wall biosynthesis
MRAKLTAIIPTGNEEHNIKAAIESVSFADEVLVVDSFSKDKTVEIAKQNGARVIQREYGNSASQKNWAIPQAEHEWILLLDADERVSSKLKEEVVEILENGSSSDAFWIYRQNYFMGKKLNYSGGQGDKVIRLFRKSKSRYEDKHVHAEVLVDGKVGYLKNKLEHYTYKDLGHLLYKSDRYTTWGAYDRVAKTKQVTAFHLLLKPLFTFVKKYIFQVLEIAN